MADTWYVEYSFKQHVTFHEGFKTICVVPCRPLRQLSCQPARCLFWTASRRQMSRASRPAHSQCSAIGQNCRCRLVFEFSYILYSIFHLPRHMVDPYIILLRVDEYILFEGHFFPRGHMCFAPWDRGGHVGFGAAPRRRAEAIWGGEMEGISTNSDLKGVKCKGPT